MNLHRFWFEFGSIKPHNAPRPGCGITARDYDDAIAILRETIFDGEEVPPIESFIQDVDMSQLDENHVIPNMEPPVWRGVWFPKGYRSTF